jgi:hypothetical protein
METQKIYNNILNVSSTIFPKTINDSMENLISPENRMKSIKLLRNVFPEEDL